MLLLLRLLRRHTSSGPLVDGGAEVGPNVPVPRGSKGLCGFTTAIGEAASDDRLDRLGSFHTTGLARRCAKALCHRERR